MRIALILVLFCQIADAGGFQVRAHKTRNCQVACQIATYYGMGSCLGLGRGRNHYIGLTSSHVVTAANRVEVNIRGHWVSAVVLHNGPDVDLALLGFTWTDETLNTVRVSRQQPSPGETITAISPTPKTGKVIGPGTMSEVRGQWSFMPVPAVYVREKSIPATNAMFSLRITEGDSGGGVLNQSGDLVGVLNWGIEGPGNGGVFVRADVVHDWVSQHWGGIPSGTRQAAPAIATPVPTPTWTNPNPTPAPNPTPTPNPTQPAIQEAKPKSDWWRQLVFKAASYAATTAGFGAITGGGGIGLTAAGIAWGLYRRRRNRVHDAESRRRPARPPPMPTPAPQIEPVQLVECVGCAANQAEVHGLRQALRDAEQRVVYQQTQPDNGLLRMRTALKRTAEEYPGLQPWLPFVEQTYTLLKSGEKHG